MSDELAAWHNWFLSGSSVAFRLHERISGMIILGMASPLPLKAVY